MPYSEKERKKLAAATAAATNAPAAKTASKKKGPISRKPAQKDKSKLNEWESIQELKAWRSSKPHVVCINWIVWKEIIEIDVNRCNMTPVFSSQLNVNIQSSEMYKFFLLVWELYWYVVKHLIQSNKRNQVLSSKQHLWKLQ